MRHAEPRTAKAQGLSGGSKEIRRGQRADLRGGIQRIEQPQHPGGHAGSF